MREVVRASIAALLLTTGALAVAVPAPAQAGDRVAAGIAAGALAGVAAGAILSAPRPAPYYGPAPAYYPPPTVYYGPPCYYENHRVWDGWGYTIVRERVCE
jgi:hypothetical protein